MSWCSSHYHWPMCCFAHITKNSLNFKIFEVFQSFSVNIFIMLKLFQLEAVGILLHWVLYCVKIKKKKKDLFWRRKWQPTPVFLPAKSQGQRNLADYSPWSCKESYMTQGLNSKFTYLAALGLSSSKQGLLLGQHGL